MSCASISSYYIHHLAFGSKSIKNLGNFVLLE